MNILITGNGGREHALAWKVAQSPLVKRIYVARGNAGTTLEPKTENLTLDPTDVTGLVAFAKQHAIDLVINGPEAPLSLGLADLMHQAGIPCLGPSQRAAQLESSKVFCKNFLAQHHIPTANYATFTDFTTALAYAKTQSYPLVIKADGLAGGKGVIIAQNYVEAHDAISAMLADRRFGNAGCAIVIEEFLQGEELSFICLVSDDQLVPLASSQDHKRRDNHDQGPNTGGMGAYSPAPILTDALQTRILQDIMTPTLNALRSMHTPYLGFLYAGLMITPQGEPKVLEFNCRLGDPETQPILFRLKSDLVELCLKAVRHDLTDVELEWDPRPAVSVVLASQGYPDHYDVGLPITGLTPHLSSDHKVFHAGTRQQGDTVVTDGGRVLTVTAKGASFQAALTEAYRLAHQIDWPGRFFRTDIGQRAC